MRAAFRPPAEAIVLSRPAALALDKVGPAGGAARPRPPLAAGCLLLLTSALWGGCGYSLGYRAPPGVKTAAVPIFANATFPLRREVEFELTSAFRQELQARTGLVIIDESAGPDLVVRGRILEFREWVVAEGRRDQKTESNLVARVELSVENYLERSLRQPVIQDVEPFSIEAGETFAVGRRRAIGNLAEKLVLALEDWEGEAAPPPAGGPEPAAGAEAGAP